MLEWMVYYTLPPQPIPCFAHYLIEFKIEQFTLMFYNFMQCALFELRCYIFGQNGCALRVTKGKMVIFLISEGKSHSLFNPNLQPFSFSLPSIVSSHVTSAKAPSWNLFSPRKLMKGWHWREDIEFNSNFLTSNSLMGRSMLGKSVRVKASFWSFKKFGEILGKFWENKTWPNCGSRFCLMF